MRKPRALPCSWGRGGYHGVGLLGVVGYELLGVERAGVADVAQHEEQDGYGVEGCQDEPFAADDLLAPQQVEHDGVGRRQQDGYEQPAHQAHVLALRLGVELLQLAVEGHQSAVAEADYAEHLQAVQHGSHRVRRLAGGNQYSQRDQQARHEDEPGDAVRERTGREAADVEEVDGIDRQGARRPERLERAGQSFRSIYII